MHRDIVVMGASAGGVEALSEVVANLPGDIDAAVFVVLHLPPTAASVLPGLLQGRTSIPTTNPADGERIRSGHIYVAPPDHHLLLSESSVQLSRGAKENGHRPAVDVLFRSAARAFGPRVIGVVLSGALDDGALGLRVIASRGGAAVVQDPEDAAFPGMPLSALSAVPRATMAAADQIGQVVGEMSQSPMGLEGIGAMKDDAFVSEDENGDIWESDKDDQPSVFTCPECHGTLFLTEEGTLARFECRVGHGFSTESLLASESEALESALWMALRSFEERNDLLHRMAERAKRQGQFGAADRFQDQVQDGERNAGLLRQVLLGGETARDESA